MHSGANEEVRREHIENVLCLYAQDLEQSARFLGISEEELRESMRSLGIPLEPV
jgi:DNA-binding NtrC family response regulator